MSSRYALIGLTAVAILCCTSVTLADNNEAAQFFDKGKALLADGDFDAALTAFKAASEADPKNKEYARENSLIRRVIAIRGQFAEEQDADTRFDMGRALLGFYMDRKINGEALTMATTLHKEKNNSESAVMLAVAELALSKNDEAAQLLAGLDDEQRTEHSEILRGIALARLGKMDEAGAIAAKIKLPKDCGGDICYDAARLYALTGDKTNALKNLTCAFECTPQTFLDAIKDDAKNNTDLAAIAGGDEFVKVLATKSKIKGCGGCASKGGCADDKAKAGCGDDKAKAGCDKDKDAKKPE